MSLVRDKRTKKIVKYRFYYLGVVCGRYRWVHKVEQDSVPIILVWCLVLSSWLLSHSQ